MLDPTRALQLAFLTLAVAPSITAQGELRTLSPAEMEEDLLLLWETLETQHTGRLRYAEPEELDEVFGDVLIACSEERTALQFFRDVSTVVSRIRCGHTGVRIGARDRREALARTGLLPFEVHVDGERAWVVRVLDDSAELKPGAELLTIDGLTIAEIRARAFSRLFDDGFIETGKERELERRFAQHYALLVEEHDEPHAQHVVEIVGALEPVTVEGITNEEYERARKKNDPRPVVTLAFPEENLGHLSVSTFGDPDGGEPTFPELIEASFRTLRQGGIEHLALDLRGNGGGDDTYGALLVSYLTSEPFGYFERIEVTPAYDGMGEVVERDGMRLMLSHPGLQVQAPAELHFQGDVYLLTDGWTFSTAADVATVAHHNGLATLVGEETGGGYDGNTSGVSQSLSLPHSGLRVNVPQWMYTTANLGHEHFGRGAPPDHALRPTIGDVLVERDAELELVLRLIREE